MPNRRPFKSAGRMILIGIFTAAPLAITWVIMEFLFRQLSQLGRPWIDGIALAAAPSYPGIAQWLQNEGLLSILAAALMLIMLWALGWMTTRVVGQKVIEVFEGLIARIPVVQKVYQATKRFMTVAGNSPDGERKVVLIDFPSAEMKTIGLVTRTLRDSDTGEELAAVYVPTSPNPTSGYIEIVPVKDVTFTDWTFDQAMSFIVTGGANAPDTIGYRAERGVNRAALATPDPSDGPAT